MSVAASHPDLAAGMLLIANPQLTDENFSRSIVYLVEHSDDGSLGFIINRPLGLTLGDVWNDCPSGLADAKAAADGGPVERHKGLLLHRHPGIAETAAMGHGIFIGGNLPQIAARWASGPDRIGPRLFLGHSGWTAGQLGREIAAGAWLIRPGHSDLLALVTDPTTGSDGDQLWERLRQGPHGLPIPSLN